MRAKVSAGCLVRTVFATVRCATSSPVHPSGGYNRGTPYSIPQGQVARGEHPQSAPERETYKGMIRIKRLSFMAPVPAEKSIRSFDQDLGPAIRSVRAAPEGDKATLAARPYARWQRSDEEVTFLGALGSVDAGRSAAGRVGSTRLFRHRAGRTGGVVRRGGTGPPPSQDRVWGDDAGDLAQRLSAQGLALGCQAKTLSVDEAKTSSAELLSEYTVFLLQVGDPVLLPPVNPAGEGQQKKLQGSRWGGHEGKGGTGGRSGARHPPSRLDGFQDRRSERLGPITQRPENAAESRGSSNGTLRGMRENQWWE